MYSFWRASPVPDLQNNFSGFSVLYSWWRLPPVPDLQNILSGFSVLYSWWRGSPVPDLQNNFLVSVFYILCEGCHQFQTFKIIFLVSVFYILGEGCHQFQTFKIIFLVSVFYILSEGLHQWSRQANITRSRDHDKRDYEKYYLKVVCSVLMFVFHGVMANYFGYLELFQQKSANSLEIIPGWCNCGCKPVARKLFEVQIVNMQQKLFPSRERCL